jgi:hypothetical protein
MSGVEQRRGCRGLLEAREEVHRMGWQEQRTESKKARFCIGLGAMAEDCVQMCRKRNVVRDQHAGGGPLGPGQGWRPCRRLRTSVGSAVGSGCC